MFASDTKYTQQFDALIGDILAVTEACGVELPWLTEFLYESAFHDCAFVAYHKGDFKDWGFADEGIRDNHSDNQEAPAYQPRLSYSQRSGKGIRCRTMLQT